MELKEDVFCFNCGIAIKRTFLGALKGYKFKEGYMCEGCARNKVKEARK